MGAAAAQWLRQGGRMIDCAQNYLNEAELGDAVSECIKDGTLSSREDVFLSSKLNNPYHARKDVRPALEKSLLDLDVDYLDMFLMHWPVPFVHVPLPESKDRGLPLSYEPDQCSAVTGTNFEESHWDKTGVMPPHLAKGVSIHETWEAMVECKKAGLVKNIGVCNFNVQLLHELCINTDELPAINQCESHPFLQQWGLLKYCNNMGIQFQSYSPLGYGLFKGDNEASVIGHPVLDKIGSAYGKTSAQVALRWCVQRGVSTSPHTLKENEMQQNLDIFDFELSAEDMAAIRKLELGHHYLRPDTWYGLPYWD